MAETLEFQLFTLDIHGGITDAGRLSFSKALNQSVFAPQAAIVDFLEQSIAKANSSSGAAWFAMDCLDEMSQRRCLKKAWRAYERQFRMLCDLAST